MTQAMKTTTIQRFPSELPLPFSKVVRAGGFLFLSGQVAAPPTASQRAGGIEQQTEAVLAGIAATLAEHGCGLEDVVRASVWLADLADFPRFNEVYARHFGDALPTRSTVEAKLAHGALVEIEVQALERHAS